MCSCNSGFVMVDSCTDPSVLRHTPVRVSHGMTVSLRQKIFPKEIVLILQISSDWKQNTFCSSSWCVMYARHPYFINVYFYIVSTFASLFNFYNNLIWAFKLAKRVIHLIMFCVAYTSNKNFVTVLFASWRRAGSREHTLPTKHHIHPPSWSNFMT